MRGEEGGGRVLLLRVPLSLFLFFLSRRRRYVPLLFVSVEAATGVAAASAPCSSLLSATTSFDSFFLSASTRECVKQNETRVPAPCRLTRLDPSFRPLVLRPRERKKTLPRKKSSRVWEDSKEFFFSRNLAIFPRRARESMKKKGCFDRWIDSKSRRIRFSFSEIQAIFPGRIYDDWIAMVESRAGVANAIRFFFCLI